MHFQSVVLSCPVLQFISIQIYGKLETLGLCSCSLLLGSLSNNDGDGYENATWKSEFALSQTLSRLFQLVYFVKCWQIFLELNSKRLYQSSGIEKESCCLEFPSSTRREIRRFHVVVVQRRQKNVQKSVMHVQSCCFDLLLFSVLVASPLLKLPGDCRGRQEDTKLSPRNNRFYNWLFDLTFWALNLIQWEEIGSF